MGCCWGVVGVVLGGRVGWWVGRVVVTTQTLEGGPGLSSLSLGSFRGILVVFEAPGP